MDTKPVQSPDESDAQFIERLRAWASRNGAAAREELRLMIEERERNARAVRLKRDNEVIGSTGTDHFLPPGLYTDGGLLNETPTAPDAPDTSSSDFSGGGGDFSGGGSSDSY